MTSDRRPEPEKPAPDPRAEREAKLAQALRANLRRRKAEPKGKAAAPDDGESA
jgi:hypothetical protein